MNIPEVKEHKHTAASCAINKGKTYDLIKIHENKIKLSVNHDGDEILKNKVIKIKTNPLSKFQTMISYSAEPKEEGPPMIILTEDVIKVEELGYGRKDEDESEADTPPDTPALMFQLEDMMKRDDKRNRLVLARQTRLEISEITEEIEDRDSDGEEQSHSQEIGDEGSKGHNSKDEEIEENSETESIESIETVDYGFLEKRE